MNPEQIEKLCQAARQRLEQFINRVDAQHKRRMREQWNKK